jgi:eukaryotic-like serine/threonine-protein kinase
LDALWEAVKIGREVGYSDDRFDRLRDEAIASMMLPDLKQAGPPILLPGVITAFAFDDGMTRYAFRGIDGTIVVRRIGDNQEIDRFTAKGDRDIWIFGFSPDGRYLVSRDGNTISVWDVDRKSLVWTVPGECRIWATSFAPDSRRIAVAPGEGTILVYELATGQCSSWSGPAEVQHLAFRPDGAEIAVVYQGGQRICRFLDAETGRERRAIPIPIPICSSIAWSPDGSTLAIVEPIQETARSSAKIALFNATRGERGATLEVPSDGVIATFHPAGTLLATTGWEGRLRLWDPASGRERLSLTGGNLAFSKDGRIFVWQGNNEVIPWQVDPAVEYTTLRNASNLSLNHARASIHRDGRILAVGTDHGVILRDLARRTNLDFLPIGNAWHSMFEPSGDLLTNDDAGVLRWAIRTDPTSGEVRIGPPRSLLSLRGTHCGIAVDRTCQIVAVAGHQEARVSLGDRTITVGPLDDCRGVLLSPDGKWLATSRHAHDGLAIWSLPDRAMLTLENATVPQFSPDGKWLATEQGVSSRLWEVGSWREIRQFEGVLQDFSHDGRLGIVLDSSNVLRLIEIETGRILARIERPDQQTVWFRFSPDSSRLIGTTHDPPSAQVIDLRLIRRRLASMGLDWDAPAFPEEDPARSDLPPLPPLKVDYGFLPPDSGALERGS